MNNFLYGELIQYRLAQSEETLKEAQLLLKAGHLRGAINRAYYAMFYAVQALLLGKDLQTSKHTGALSLFDQEFVKTGEFDKNYSSWLHELFDFRQEADYGPMVQISLEEASQVLKNSETFVFKVKSYILGGDAKSLSGI